MNIKRVIKYFLLFLFLQLGLTAQWQSIVKQDGLDVRFIFYSEANGVANNGVVIYLINENEYKISYEFELIFKSADAVKTDFVSGELKALERKTGSNDNLFWIPFDDSTEISEVGLTKLRVKKVN